MKKILLIDDDADIRDSLKTVLDTEYEVKEAESQKQGFEVLKTFTPDLICLDVMMESTSSGFDMARKLKNDPLYKNIKILMFTSVDSEMNIDFKSSAGDEDWLPVDDYLEKPVKPRDILEKVAKLLG
jgi:CheY-like chemotaxis protein